MIIQDPIFARSLTVVEAKNNYATPLDTTIVYNGRVDMSLNESSQADYTYYRVNVFAGQGTYWQPKNVVKFNVAPTILDYIPKPTSFTPVTTDNVSAMTNAMSNDLYAKVQFDIYTNGVQLVNRIGSADYRIAFRGYVDSMEQEYADSNTVDTPTAPDGVSSIYLNDFYTTTYIPTLPLGSIHLYTPSATTVVYKGLVSGTEYSHSLVTNLLQVIPYVHKDLLNEGNLVTISDGSGVLKQFRFTPKKECKYSPITCDFIGKYGVWKRIFFYKASYENFEVQNEQYRFSDLTLNEYATYNHEGKTSIKVNTDWVDESFKQDLKELMLSETILLGGLPARMRTKSTELHKNINNKTINYTLEFDYNFDEFRPTL